MAITKIQEPTNIWEADASVTKAWVSAPTVENLLIAFAYGSNNISNASISGWTLAVSCQYNGAGGYVGIFYKVAGASEGDVTLNWTDSNSTGMGLFEYSEVNTIDKTAFTATDGTAVTSRSSGTTAATTASAELALSVVRTGGGVTSLTWSNSFTAEFAGTDINWAYKILSSTGAQETTASWTTAQRAGACIATFKYVAASSAVQTRYNRSLMGVGL